MSIKKKNRENELEKKKNTEEKEKQTWALSHIIFFNYSPSSLSVWKINK